MPSETAPAPRRPRVPALAPDDRRAAIVSAAIPLIRERGFTVTSRQIAAAAGVAEGTVYGVFPDKAALFRAVLLTALDPAPLERAISAIDPTAPLRERLTDAVAILWRRFKENGPLIVAYHAVAAEVGSPGELRAHLDGARQRLFTAVAAVVRPDEALLRQDADTVARMVVHLVFAAHQGAFGPAGPDGSAVVDLILHGVLAGPVNGGTRC